jgi:hypothetical protein
MLFHCNACMHACMYALMKHIYHGRDRDRDRDTQNSVICDFDLFKSSKSGG